MNSWKAWTPRSNSVALLFDYISPNAYLAWLALPELARRHGREIVPWPVFYPGILRSLRLTGPAETAQRWSWMLRDLLRKRRRHGFPFEPPAAHPFDPLPALRVTVQPMPADRRQALIDRLFRATWAESEAVWRPEVLERQVNAVGLDGAALVSRIRDDTVKRMLQESTEAACRRGAFGVPTVLVGDQLFWGFDDLSNLDRHLAGEQPVPDDLLERWRRVPSRIRSRRS